MSVGEDGDFHPRVDVHGVSVSAGTLVGIADAIVERTGGGVSGYVCVAGAHGVVLCQDDPELLDIHRRALMVTTDGMPLVRAVRRAGYLDATRVYGPDLMLEVCGRRVGELRHLLYGSTPEVLDDLRHNLEQRFPGIILIATISPPFRPLTEAEVEAERASIRSARPDVVWVGLSTPKQERWMAANVDHLGGAVLVGVGAAFDFHAGRKRQAPRWMQQSGLEWLFRMLSEPRRLGPRYLSTVPRYLWLDAKELVSRPWNVAR